MNCIINLQQLEDKQLQTYEIVIDELTIFEHLLTQFNSMNTKYIIICENNNIKKLSLMLSKKYNIRWLDASKIEMKYDDVSKFEQLIEELAMMYKDKCRQFLVINPEYINFTYEWNLEKYNSSTTFLFNNIKYMKLYILNEKSENVVENNNVKIIKISSLFDLASYDNKLFYNKMLNEQMINMLIRSFKFDDAISCKTHLKNISKSEYNEYLEMLIKNFKFKKLIETLTADQYFYTHNNSYNCVLVSSFINKFNERTNEFELDISKFKSTTVNLLSCDDVRILLANEQSKLFNETTLINTYVLIYLITSNIQLITEDEKLIVDFINYIKRSKIDIMSKKCIALKMCNELTNKKARQLLIDIILFDYRYFTTGINDYFNSSEKNHGESAFLFVGDFPEQINWWFANLKLFTSSHGKLNYTLASNEQLKYSKQNDNRLSKLPPILNIDSNFKELFPYVYKKLTTPANNTNTTENIKKGSNGQYIKILEFDPQKHLSNFADKNLESMIKIYLLTRTLLADIEKKQKVMRNVVIINCNYAIKSSLSEYENFAIDNIIRSDHSNNILFEKGVSALSVETLKKYINILTKVVKETGLNNKLYDEFTKQLQNSDIFFSHNINNIVSEKTKLNESQNFTNELEVDKLNNPPAKYVESLTKILNDNFVNKKYISSEIIENISCENCKLDQNGFAINIQLFGQITNYFDFVSIELELTATSSNLKIINRTIYNNKCSVEVDEQVMTVSKYFDNNVISTAPTWEIRLKIKSANEIIIDIPTNININEISNFYTREIIGKKTLTLSLHK